MEVVRGNGCVIWSPQVQVPLQGHAFIYRQPICLLRGGIFISPGYSVPN